MNIQDIPENPYLLLTPGPLSTSKSVRAAMLRDWCTWDDDYNLGVVQDIRSRLVRLAAGESDQFTAVLMQGSGSFGVEACLGTAVPPEGKLLIIANGAYGMRMVRFMEVMKRPYVLLRAAETEQPDLSRIEEILRSDDAITHVAMVYCETTTGILNPVKEVCALAKKYEKITIIDAMSAFGGIPMDMEKLPADYLISSSNKCIQGVPGFSFILARRTLLSSVKATPTLTAWMPTTSGKPWTEAESGDLPRRPTRFALFSRRWPNWKKRAALKPAISVIKKTRGFFVKVWNGWDITPCFRRSFSLRSSRLSFIRTKTLILRHFTRP